VPEPVDPRRRRGSWSGSALRDVLHNPKYTGYMVWNRRATKSGGRVNPPSAWVWSDEPTHEPLVDRETFEAAARVAHTTSTARRAWGSAKPQAHPNRGYLLRSYVRCGLCGQRMYGKTRRGHSYFNCYPALNNADRLERHPDDHPKAIYVREDALIAALDHVIATRVFGPDRHAHLRQGLAVLPDKQRQADTALRDGLRAQIEDLTARQDRLITELENTGPTDRAFRDRLRRRFDTLETERASLTAQLHDLTEAD
jgi:site-specific DNA recombinase